MNRYLSMLVSLKCFTVHLSLPSSGQLLLRNWILPMFLDLSDRLEIVRKTYEYMHHFDKALWR